MPIDATIAGVKEKRVQERPPDKGEEPTPAKAIEIPQQPETSQTQMRIVREEDTQVPAVPSKPKPKAQNKKAFSHFQQKPTQPRQNVLNKTKTCSKCGKDPKHKWSQGKCPAKGSICPCRHKPNHWAPARRSRPASTANVEPTNDMSEDETLDINLTTDAAPAATMADDKWLVDTDIPTQKAQPRIDTGAKCNTPTPNRHQSPEPKTPKRVPRTHPNHKTKPVAAADPPPKYKDRKTKAESEIANTAQENAPSGATAEAPGPTPRPNSPRDSKVVSKMDTANITAKAPSTPAGPEKLPEPTRTTGTPPGKHTIKIDPDAKPAVHPARRQPVAPRAKTAEKSNEMVQDGHIAKVDQPTEWASPMAAATNKDKPRTCTDPSDPNNAMKREHHPTRTIEEAVPTTPNAKVPSALDAKSGPPQIELDEAPSSPTTPNTPIGRSRWPRPPPGTKCAPEIPQRTMDQMPEGATGATGTMDDIPIAAPTPKEHDQTPKKVVERATSHNPKPNPNKCHIRQSAVPHVGHPTTADGPKPDPAKTEAARCMPPPTDKEGARRPPGPVTYPSKFTPNLSEIDAPPRQPTKSDVEPAWQPAQQQAPDKPKYVRPHRPAPGPHDAPRPVEIYRDASSTGLGAAPAQDDQPVAPPSRSTTDAETRHAQTEKETLSIAHACTKLHHHIPGKHATALNDHKPPEDIHKRSPPSTPTRIQRMRPRLQRHDTTAKHKRGKDMEPPDTLSRAQPSDKTPEAGSLECVPMTNPLSVSDEKYAEPQTRTNNELSPPQQAIQHGRPGNRREVPIPVQPHWDPRSQLAVTDGTVHKGMRIVVPPTMQKHMPSPTHQSHPGTVKSKQRAREASHWPGMSAETETMIRNCSKRAEAQNKLPKQPPMPTATPEPPFEAAAPDLPEPQDKQYIVPVDHHSKYIEADTLKDQRSRTAIEAPKAQLSRHGTPAIPRTDNGPQHTSEESKEPCESHGTQHKTSSPHTPHPNGEAERAAQTAKRLWSKTPDKHPALPDYRTTPPESVGLSPAQPLMGRRPRNKPPTARALPRPMNHDSPKVKHPLDKTKRTQKPHHDKRAVRPRPDPRPGDEVRMAPYPGNQKWSPAVVVKPHSAPRSYIVDSGGKFLRRTSQHLRTSTATANQTRHITPDEEPWSEPLEASVGKEQKCATAPPDPPSSPSVVPHHSQAQTGEHYRTRRGRAVKPPDKLNL